MKWSTNGLNHLFVKSSFTNQSSSLKMIDRWNVHMFVRLQISFWNTSSENTGDWNTSYKNTSFRNTADWNTSYSGFLLVHAYLRS